MQAYHSLRDRSRSHSGPRRGETGREAQVSRQGRADPMVLSPEYAQPKKSREEKEPRHDPDDLRLEYLKRDG